MDKIKIPVILGPTASGKSSMTMDLATELDLSVISCDSRQIYRYMDIGTAKPSKDDVKNVKHYLIDIIEPDNEFSAFAYQKEALKIIREGDKKGERFIICGGTGLYFEALSEGVGPQISTDPEIIKYYTQKASIEGRESIYQELKSLDLKAANKLHPNDLQRVIRAIAVYKQEGVSIIDLQNRKSPPDDIEFDIIKLNPPRDQLYNRINKRVDIMANEGLFDEFTSLLARGYTESDSGMRTVGYQEFFNRVDDTDLSLKDVFDKIKQNSRKYAKRQYTWFNNRVRGISVDSFDKEQILSAKNKIKIFLDIKS